MTNQQIQKRTPQSVKNVGEFGASGSLLEPMFNQVAFVRVWLRKVVEGATGLRFLFLVVLPTVISIAQKPFAYLVRFHKKRTPLSRGFSRLPARERLSITTPDYTISKGDRFKDGRQAFVRFRRAEP